MDKQKVITAIQSANKGSPFITQTRLASIMRKNTDWAKRVVEGLDVIPADQRGDIYFIPDVVDRLLERRIV